MTRWNNIINRNILNLYLQFQFCCFVALSINNTFLNGIIRVTLKKEMKMIVLTGVWFVQQQLQQQQQQNTKGMCIKSSGNVPVFL